MKLELFCRNFRPLIKKKEKERKKGRDNVIWTGMIVIPGAPQAASAQSGRREAGHGGAAGKC